jgi:hypothetical protein
MGLVTFANYPETAAPPGDKLPGTQRVPAAGGRRGAASVTDQPAAGESQIVPFLRAGPPPDRTRWEGWQQWRTNRGSFIPAPRLSLAEYQALSARSRALHDLHRTATHVNLRLQETPMSRKVSDLMRGRLQNNAVKFAPGTRDGLMISGGGFQGKTETACWAAAEFEDLWRGIHRQLAPGPAPGTRDLFVPVAYCRLPVRATPKALCKTILDVYGDPHPATLHDLVRSVRDAVRDHATTALLIDDITRLRLHRGDDQSARARAVGVAPPSPDPQLAEAAKIVVKRKGIGTIPLDELAPDRREGYPSGAWSSTLIIALYWCDGQRNLADVIRLTRLELGPVKFDFVGYFKFLARKGYVELK